jgi:hypothetical protein
MTVMILEVLLSTLDQDGSPRIVPAGVRWGETHLELFSYRTSRTCDNLLKGRGAVANLCDDALLFVRCALDEAAKKEQPCRPSGRVPGAILERACSYRELRLLAALGEGERICFSCEVVGTGTIREFLGFNRAAGALLELAVAATRRALLPEEAWKPLWNQACRCVERTGGPRELEALSVLQDCFFGEEEKV